MLKCWRTMVSRFILLLLLVLITGCSSLGLRDNELADISGPCTPAMYEIRSPTGVTSYLLGTIHIGVSSQDLPTKIWGWERSAPLLVVEIDLFAPENANQPPAIKDMVLPPSQSLHAMLGQARFIKLHKILGGTIAAESLDRLKPHVIISMIYLRLFPQTGSMDLDLMRAARRSGKTIVGLETTAYQLDVLTKVAGADMLREMIDKFAEQKRELYQLLADYRHGDLDQLYVRMVSSSAVDPGMDAQSQELLLKKRNVKWVVPLGAILNERSAFIAVGAAHLPGKDGLVHLLEQKGFKLKRVVYK